METTDTELARCGDIVLPLSLLCAFFPNLSIKAHEGTIWHMSCRSIPKGMCIFNGLQWVSVRLSNRLRVHCRPHCSQTR
jgi:hypothetical protein